MKFYKDRRSSLRRFEYLFNRRTADIYMLMRNFNAQKFTEYIYIYLRYSKIYRISEAEYLFLKIFNKWNKSAM